MGKENEITVYFENSYGKEREIGEGKTQEACMKIIHEFLDEREYKSYYSRQWETEKGLKIDVGSHSEFFYIREKA